MRSRIKRVIEQVEAAGTFQQIANLKRLESKGKYYRIRVGNYRLGFVFEDGAVSFVRMPRGDGMQACYGETEAKSNAGGESGAVLTTNESQH